MTGSTTELIKQKLDIVEFLRGYLQVTPAGKNFKARCPFHNEKTPSFMISPDRQSWHCFGCGAGGDIFAFLMRYENLEFGEALRVLAEKAGVELKRLNPQEYKLTGLLYELNDKAKEYFSNALKNSEPAKKYLASRHLNQETIDEFELGWAPNEFEGLSMHLLKAGYSPDDLLRAGIAIKTERGLLGDRFRGRIMFPIHNHFGRVVGFTGRVLPQFETDAVGKYVNSPETAIFQKSRLLYGFWKSKNSIREAGSTFLVEGQMDFLMSWQAGIKNVVASSGTALTPDHLRVLHRLGEELVLSFDNDSAGEAAAERAIDLAESHDFGVKVAAFDEYKDPAEAAEKNPEFLRNVVKNAVAAPKFYFRKYLPEGKTDWSRRENLKNLRAVLAKLKSISSAVERDVWLKELEKITEVSHNTLLEELGRIEVRAAPEAQKEVPIAEKRIMRKELIGERLLRAGVARNDFDFINDYASSFAAPQKKVFELLRSGKRKSSDPGLDEAISFIVLGAEDLPEEEIARLKREFELEHHKEKRKELTSAVRKAEEAGNAAELRSALEALSKLAAPVFES
ncbi:MAG: DNA primase [Patescibacteria group bacterium]